jgi:hypothetical protein
MNARIKVVLKWTGILLVTGFITQIIVTILVGVVAGLTSGGVYNENNLLLISRIISLISVLPLAYWCSYKAVAEYLQGKNKYQKGIGLNIALGVIFLTVGINGIINYVLSGSFNFSAGVLPIVLGFIAGRQAESKYAKGRK